MRYGLTIAVVLAWVGTAQTKGLGSAGDCGAMTADLNGDGKVDFSDFFILADQFGTTCRPLPVAVATAEPARLKPPGEGEVVLRGRGSSDPMGGELAFHWRQSSDNPFPVSFSANDTSTAFAVRVSLRELGAYSFILTVTNELGHRSRPDTVVVIVNTPPVAVAHDGGAVTVGDEVELDSDESFDAESKSSALSYRWTPPSGITLSNETDSDPRFLASSVGTFTFSLVVNDGIEDSTPALLEVKVDPAPDPMDFVWIAPGTFMMGAAQQHQVQISRGFYLGKYEVTRGLWDKVMGPRNWSRLARPSKPAEISWDDAQELVRRLNQAAGDSLYRLPTEAEWEYACRAGTTTTWSFGDYGLESYGWYDSWNGPHRVGLKRPNPWGLYDMHGNVEEWVQDWYGEYPSSSQIDPQGPSSGTNRIARGGSYRDWQPERTESASRGWGGGASGARLLRIK